MDKSYTLQDIEDEIRKCEYYVNISAGDNHRAKFQLRLDAAKLLKEKEVQIQDILREVHNAGGCDASTEYDKGYDAGIAVALEVIEKITCVSVDTALSNKEVERC